MDSSVIQMQERRFKFIGCEIVYREACHLAAMCPHRVDVEFLRKGLHNLETADMVDALQRAIDVIDPALGYEAILLGYARCNDGLVGVRARNIPLVIPKAHDCITLLMGSRKAYREYFDTHPGTYYASTGWMERDVDDTDGLGFETKRPGVMAKLGLDMSYEQMVAKHGKENADYIIESLGGWQQLYSRLLYLRMGPLDEQRFVDAARTEAERRGWEFEARDGDMSLLRRLFHAEWNDDFLIVPPGEAIASANDEQVLRLSDKNKGK